MAMEKLTEVKTRKGYYSENYRFLVSLLFASMLVIVFLILAVVYLVFNKSAPNYYASSSNGNLVKLQAVNRGVGLEEFDR